MCSLVCRVLAATPQESARSCWTSVVLQPSHLEHHAHYHAALQYLTADLPNILSAQGDLELFSCSNGFGQLALITQQEQSHYSRVPPQSVHCGWTGCSTRSWACSNRSWLLPWLLPRAGGTSCGTAKSTTAATVAEAPAILACSWWVGLAAAILALEAVYASMMFWPVNMVGWSLHDDWHSVPLLNSKHT